MATTGCLTDDQLNDYANGALDQAENKRIERHLRDCQRCRRKHVAADEDVGELPAQPTVAAEQETEFVTVRPDVKTIPHEAGRDSLPKIPGYELLEEIGRGGMGIVYRAIQKPLGREVALKLLPSNLATMRPDAVDRFRREAAAASKLHHNNIIPVYDFGAARGAYYFAMELIAGQPLNELIPRLGEQHAQTLSPARLAALLSSHTPDASGLAFGPGGDDTRTDDSVHGSGTSTTGRGHIYYQQVARWMGAVAEALHYAHGRGIIHRDVKPGNLILSVDGRIMLADFGLAKVIGEDAITMTGSLLGTIRYLSPEQAMAKRIPLDHRTDIYSLGATMYELLCFAPAFPGSNDQQILAAIITRDPTPLRKIERTVPAELETICLKTLEKAPDARYATARALAEDLRRYIDDVPIVAKRVGPLRRTQKFVRRHKPGVIAGVATLLMVIAGALYFQADRKRGHEERKRVHAERQQILAEAERLVEEAIRLSGSGQLEDAVASLNESLRIDPDHFRAHANLCSVMKDLFNSSAIPDPTLLDQALEHCNKALALDPNSPTLWNATGVVLKKLKRWEKAAEAYAKAIELQPDDPYWWNNLGEIHALAGDLVAGEEKLRKAVELAAQHDPPECFPWRDLASFQLFRESTEALATINKAIKCDPNDANARLIHARLRLQLEGYVDYVEALREARNAADYGNRFAGRSNRILALAYLRNDNFDEAVAQAHEAMAQGDHPAFNHLIISIAEANREDIAAARVQLEKARAAWPTEFEDKSYIATADKGILWFDTRAELEEFRGEAEGLIASGSAHP